MYHVTAIGELLIDLTPSGKNDMGMDLFAANPGGAPANVLAAVSRFGQKAAFIGKVGNDSFGHFLRKTLDQAGIDTTGLTETNEVNTTLAFVHLTPDGDRSFSFYRKPGADVMLTWNEVDQTLIDRCAVFHFGGVSLTDEPCRTATLEAARYAKAHGKLVSYDPNYRPLLWSSPDDAKREILAGMPLADIVKVSEEELTLLTGATSLEAGAAKLAESGVSLVLVSLGAKGAFYHTAAHHGVLPTYDVKTIDTTGAGDAFFGAVLYRLGRKTAADICAMDADALADIIDFANACGSLTTTQKGAIPALPSLDEIEACRQTVKKL